MPQNLDYSILPADETDVTGSSPSCLVDDDIPPPQRHKYSMKNLRMPKAFHKPVPRPLRKEKTHEVRQELKSKHKLRKLSSQALDDFQAIFHELKERDVNAIERIATLRMRAKELDARNMDKWGKKNLGISHFGFRFDLLIHGVVIMNSVEIAITTNMFAAGEEIKKAPWTVYAHIFCVIFVLEFIVRLRILGSVYFHRPWYVVDFALVVFAILDNWILSTAINGYGRTMSVARVFRLLKLVRLVKLIKTFRSVWLLVIGFVSSVPTLCGAMALLALVLFAASIYLVQHLATFPPDDVLELQNRGLDKRAVFGSVERAMWKLFGCVMGGCWESVFTPLYDIDWTTGVFALIFVFLTVFGLLNILVGIFCDTCMVTFEREMSMTSLFLETRQGEELKCLETLWTYTDREEKGYITESDLYRAMEEDMPAMEALEELQLEAVDARELYSHLNPSMDGMVSMRQFISGLLKLNFTSMNLNSIHLMTRRIEFMNEERDVRIETMMQNQQKLATNQDLLRQRQVRIAADVHRMAEGSSAILRAVKELREQVADAKAWRDKKMWEGHGNPPMYDDPLLSCTSFLPDKCKYNSNSELALIE